MPSPFFVMGTKKRGGLGEVKEEPMFFSKKSKIFLRFKKSNFLLGLICLLVILFLLPGCCDKEEVSKPETPATEPPVAEVAPPDLPDPLIF